MDMDITPETIVGLGGSIITALATLILAVLTGRYVRLTNALVNEAKTAKFPNVFVDIELANDGDDVRFIVGNTGPSAAQNIQFRVQDNLPWDKPSFFGDGIASLSAIKDGISYLAPGRILKYQAGTISRFADLHADKKSIEVTLTFETESAKIIKREFSIELRSYSRVLLESFMHPEREVARAIRDAEHHRSTRENSGRRPMMYFGKKPCPICGENISFKAKKCPHCLEFVPSAKDTDGTTP